MLGKIKSLTSSLKQPKLTEGGNDQFIVALDIGTEYIKALIARLNKDNLEIVGVGRAYQQQGDMQAGAIADINAVVGNCDEALNEAEAQAGVSVRTAVVGIAGELVKGMTTTVRCTRKDASKPLDIAEIEKIISLVQERAAKKARRELAIELGGKGVQTRLVNSALVGMTIDGYAVTNPVGFQGQDVVVQLYTAFAPLVHIGALERSAQELDLDLLAVAAEPFAVTRAVLGNDQDASISAILMDVGGGTTDIAVINEGGVQGTKMFGIGGRAFTKSIERDLGIDFAEAEKLKIAFSKGRSPQARMRLVEESLDNTLDVWISGVELALSEFSQLDHLPHRILLCGGGASLHKLVEKLQRDSWYRQLPFARKPTIQHIRPEQITNIVDSTGAVDDHTFVTAAGLLRVGADTIDQNLGAKSAGSIKQKIDRILRV